MTLASKSCDPRRYLKLSAYPFIASSYRRMRRCVATNTHTVHNLDAILSSKKHRAIRYYYNQQNEKT